MKIFKLQIYTLTGVPPEGQKLIGLVKGSMLKDDTDLKSLNIKEVSILFYLLTNKYLSH